MSPKFASVTSIPIFCLGSNKSIPLGLSLWCCFSSVNISYRLENLDNKIDLKFEEKNKDDDEKEAKRLRASIIAFSDSCRVNTKHTKQHFENVFRDIDDYNLYCMKHNIPNHYIDGEVSYITSIYEKCLRENSFL